MHSQMFDSALLEKTEAECVFRLESGAPRRTLDDMGIATARFGGGSVMAMRRDVTRYWNKALGFGFDEPVTGDLIAQVCAFFREHDAPVAVLQLAPAVLSSDWDDICRTNGMGRGGSWLKLGHDLETVDPPATDLRVGRVDVSDAGEWASVFLRGFGMPEEGLLAMMAASVGQPGFRSYAAWDGDEIVGAANLFVHGDVAALAGASTLPSHRRRGVQSALMAARLLDARAGGRLPAGRRGDGSRGPR